jgi:hypothetical protein
LGFFDQYAQADVFIAYDDVQYDRRSWRNRNRILTAAGVRWLTVPVLSRGRHAQLLSEVRIADERWPARHLRTLRESYARAPYLDYLMPTLERVLTCGYETLLDVDLAVIRALLEILGLDPSRLRLSSELGAVGAKTSRLVSLCERVGAREYLTGDAARGYIDASAFERAGIRLLFHDYRHPTYRQLHGPFVSHLSVVDLIFNEGPNACDILRRGSRPPSERSSS